MTTRKLLPAFFLAVLLSLPLVAAREARAQAPSEPRATTVTVAPTEQQTGKPVSFSAKLADNRGQALGGMLLKFYVETEPFGPRLMKVGETTTDAAGTGTVSWKPTWVGEIKAVVIFPGTKDYATSQTKLQFNAVGPVRGHENAKFGLETVRDWAPFVVGVLVALIWATFVVVVVRVVVAVRAGEPTAASQEATVPRGALKE